MPPERLTGVGRHRVTIKHQGRQVHPLHGMIAFIMHPAKGNGIPESRMTTETRWR
ncbi:hypothetical protein [Rhodovulum steppense]|nr:hypothetical protein [Rhodovulum steppense]